MPSDFITFKVCFEVQVMILLLLITLHPSPAQTGSGCLLLNLYFHVWYHIRQLPSLWEHNRSGNNGALPQICPGIYLSKCMAVPLFTFRPSETEFVIACLIWNCHNTNSQRSFSMKCHNYANKSSICPNNSLYTFYLLICILSYLLYNVRVWIMHKCNLNLCTSDLSHQHLCNMIKKRKVLNCSFIIYIYIYIYI